VNITNQNHRIKNTNLFLRSGKDGVGTSEQTPPESNNGKREICITSLNSKLDQESSQVFDFLGNTSRQQILWFVANAVEKQAKA
jgi:hypothetical protein